MVAPFHKPVVCPVLIDRVNDLATLQALIDQAKSGRGQVILLSGEAGIGKSRLVAEVKTYAASHDFLILQGSCFPTDHAIPYAPLLDFLRFFLADHSITMPAPEVKQVAQAFLPLLPDAGHLLPDVPPVPPLTSLDPEQEKRRRFEILVDFLTAQTVEQPVFLIVEDLHWSDDISLEFLRYLARRCSAHPLLLLLTYRSDEVRPILRHFLAQLDRERLAQEISLSRLTSSEVDAMLRAIFALSHSARLELPDFIYTLTEGNPFFVEELLKSLMMTGDIFYENGRWERKWLSELNIPRSVQDAVQQRTDRLSEGARRVLTLAAVTGRRFDFALLQQLTHYDENQLLLSIKELIAAQFVVEESEEQFAFRHALTWQAVYADLLVRERKALHRSIAETMEHLYATAFDAHLAELAYHFYEAGAWEQALEYGQRAGEKAQAMYASRAAIEQFTRALDATHHLGRVAPPKIYQARGQSYETLGEFEQARSDYERALETARSVHDQSAEWESFIALGFLWAGRDYAQTGTYYQQALDLARSMGDPLTLAHSLNRLGNWWLNTGQATEALAAHQEALALFQGQKHRQGMAETLDLLGMAYGISGNAVGAVIQYGRAIDLFRALEDTRGLATSLPVRSILASPAQAEPVATPYWDLTACERDATEALSLCRQIEWAAGEAYAEICLGLILAFFGHFGRSLAHTQRGLRIATEIDHQQWIAGAHCYLGHIYVLMLAPKEALHHLEVGLALASQLGSSWWVGNIVAYRALAYLLQGERERAEAELQAVILPVQHPHTLPERRLLWVWSELALAQGKPKACLDMVDQLLQSAPQSEGETEGQPIPWLLKCKGEALSALKRLEEAVQVLEEAQRGALLRQEPPVLWQIQRALGRVYRLLRREEEAKRAYELARDTITSLAETIDDPDLHAHFVETALLSLPREKPLSLRRAAAQQFGGLTERERTVAALVAQGKSNREIADALIVSERTAESHVGNILAKLGFASRAQIAAWTMEQGLATRP